MVKRMKTDLKGAYRTEEIANNMKHGWNTGTQFRFQKPGLQVFKFIHYTSVQKSEFLRRVFLWGEKIRPANSSKRFRLLDMDIYLGELVPRLTYLSPSME